MRNIALATATALFLAAPSAAQQRKDATPPVPPVMGRVIACSAIGEAAGRLACFDREVAVMNQAQKSGDLVAMDRQQVSKTRRTLFGLALPDLGFLGDDAAMGDVSSIETTLKSARMGGDGKWIFDLAEGGRWRQVDSREIPIDPKAGQPIRIRKGSLGAYLANVNKQIAVRVRRVQ